MVDWGSLNNWCWSSLVNWGCGNVLWVLSFSIVFHISNISILGGCVCYCLSSAVRESNLVGSSCVISITLLIGIEVAEAVVVLDGVGVLVHGGLVGVGGLSIDGGGWTVCRDSRWGSHDGGHQSCGEDCLECHFCVLAS